MILHYIIVIANAKAKESRIRNKNNLSKTNIKYYSEYSLKLMISRAINETIRIVDAIEIEKQYVQYKILINNELIDIEARVYFKVGVTVGMLKCCYGIN